MWTDAEKSELIRLYHNHSDSELCLILNKTPGQVRGMKERLGLNSKINLFTEDEKQIIRQYYTDHTGAIDLDYLSCMIGRGKTSISRFARKEGLTNKSRPMSDLSIQKLAESQARYRNTEHYKTEVLPAQRDNLIQCLVNNHPRGMLGKHHTSDTRARISEGQRMYWANISSEDKALRREKCRAWHLEHGHISTPNTYSRCRRGRRDDIGVFVRSSWEANIARLFNYLNITWEYEPKRFRFKDEGDSVISYCPDFYLPDIDAWVEVKGWFDQASKLRIEKFRKYYPTEYEKLLIINEPLYKMLERLFKNNIDNWESKNK